MYFAPFYSIDSPLTLFFLIEGFLSVKLQVSVRTDDFILPSFWHKLVLYDIVLQRGTLELKVCVNCLSNCHRSKIDQQS